MVLVDTSPDMRDQLLAAGVTRLDAVLMTHDHADQSHGLDDLRALVLQARKRIPVHMDAPTEATLGQRFGYCFDGAGSYPAILDRLVDLTPGQPLDLAGAGGAMPVLPLIQDHGGGSSLGFRIGSFAYCNDVVRLPEETLARLEGLHTLVVDALRYKPHPTHASVADALAWIDRLRPRRAVLTNLHVDLDYQTLRAELPEGVEPAFDGMELEIPSNA